MTGDPQDPGTFLTPADVAKMLRVSIRTVEHWRTTSSGPKWFKVGRHVLYDRKDLDDWIRQVKGG